MAFALYFVVPCGQHDRKSKGVIALARPIGRSPNAAGLKLGNMSDTKVNKGKLRWQFYRSRWPLANELVDYVFEMYFGGTDSWEYSNQDAYE